MCASQIFQNRMNYSLFNSFFNSLLTLEAALAAAGDRADSAAEMLFVKHVPFLSLLRLLRLVVRGGDWGMGYI